MDTNLKLTRYVFSDKSTIGYLESSDGEKICDTLEDTVRRDGEKVAGKTAIPKGKYEVVWNMSNRFKREMPLLLNVPNFAGVRIHSGNKPEDTEGCILCVEYNTDEPDWISNSKINTEKVYKIIKSSIEEGNKVFLWIS